MYRAGQKRIAQCALKALSQEACGVLREMQGMKAANEYTSEGLEAASDNLALEAGPAAADLSFAAEQSCDGATPEQHSRGQQQMQQRQSSQASATEPPYYVTVETVSTTEQCAQPLYRKQYWPEQLSHPAQGSSHLQVLSALLQFRCFASVYEMQSALSLARDLLMVYHAASSVTWDM